MQEQLNVPYQISPPPLIPHRNPEYPGIALQHRMRAISLAQLVNKWQALHALHRTLLHDFMLASQHLSASPALRRVAQKYAMPARMWRHGIHSFLELLRHHLPEAREHMITFIYTAYSIIALLYESVDAFRDTWIECLGDLARYRVAIEDDNQRVRDAWTQVSRRWYTLASDNPPGTGRLYHHLAILARPSIVTQFFYYSKSLCVLVPFVSTYDSIKTLLEPIIKGLPQRVQPPKVKADLYDMQSVSV
ncbi:telomerase-binding protein est1a [Ophiostoma piceae UAMH 11346]|uniref:Telomerase-binding protein est1a n=1 Tax=Ophiostoma piceae (strain UAMH 11346) TaxID=1262450 RepID=S3BZV7_OPHP1|nr:telomerase-binding protein est1a [Ophiostoma piceae UAMH 11346]